MGIDVDSFVVELGEALKTELDGIGDGLVACVDQGFAVPRRYILFGWQFVAVPWCGWNDVRGRVMGLGRCLLELWARLWASLPVDGVDLCRPL
ncbi:hypothetical protein B0T14DRAFT_501438 [Immersiella caudata]|uniref:Uncharacterized protein n=1 Tax=Immersiella caudata TaxID=314043 RepID=A0AA39XCA6_9PEZI|nr:hypothetical protein B0T14DRAFT_501438 [Immersiella caudata]